MRKTLVILGALFLWAVVFFATFLAWAQCGGPAARSAPGLCVPWSVLSFPLAYVFPVGDWMYLFFAGNSALWCALVLVIGRSVVRLLARRGREAPR